MRRGDDVWNVIRDMRSRWKWEDIIERFSCLEKGFIDKRLWKVRI